MARKWSRRRKIAVGVGAGVAVAAAAAGVTWALTRRRPKIPSVIGPEASVAPQQGAREPEGGYEARWASARDEALALCQADPEVDTWPQAVSCALSVAFPEAGPWTDPAVWQPWMQEAATLVEADMLTEARPDGTSPTHWEMMLWLRAQREAEVCAAAMGKTSIGRVAKIAQCVASAIYPGPDWSAPQPGWQQDFLSQLRKQIPSMV